MFAAASAGGSPASGTQFQRFVEELWVNQDPGGPSFSGDELREMAVAAGMSARLADALTEDQSAVDIAELNDTNFIYLVDVDPVQTGTPTVYDLESAEKVDITESDWLNQLVHS